MKLNSKKILAIMLFVIAAVSIVFAILCFSEHGYSSWCSYESYGGDAYTGIQNAAADTANNISDLQYDLVYISGYAFILVGLVFALLGVYNILASKDDEKAEAACKASSKNQAQLLSNIENLLKEAIVHKGDE